MGTIRPARDRSRLRLAEGIGMVLALSELEVLVCFAIELPLR